jgi:hypothetical protein
MLHNTPIRRIAYCVEMDVIERSLPGFEQAARKYGLR